jgi:hypothetical protein
MAYPSQLRTGNSFPPATCLSRGYYGTVSNSTSIKCGLIGFRDTDTYLPTSIFALVVITSPHQQLEPCVQDFIGKPRSFHTLTSTQYYMLPVFEYGTIQSTILPYRELILALKSGLEVR